MALSKQLITQSLALSLGFLMIFICLFLYNGEAYIPEIDQNGYITYTGKAIIEIQGIKIKGDIKCKESDSFRECQIFKATLSLAIVSMIFGGLSLLTIILRDQERVKIVFQRYNYLNIFVSIGMFVPVFIEIFMPTWKIIHSNDPELTYKIGPVILELISFVSFSFAFVTEVLQWNKQTKIGLLQ